MKDQVVLPLGFLLERFPEAHHTPCGPWEDVYGVIRDTHGGVCAYFFVDPRALMQGLAALLPEEPLPSDTAS